MDSDTKERNIHVQEVLSLNDYSIRQKVISSRREELRVIEIQKITFCLEISKGFISGAGSTGNNMVTDGIRTQKSICEHWCARLQQLYNWHYYVKIIQLLKYKLGEGSFNRI